MTCLQCKHSDGVTCYIHATSGKNKTPCEEFESKTPGADMVKVSSSNIDAIGLDGDNLKIQFKGGGLYLYYDVPEPITRALMAANSKGRYFYNHIRGKFLFQKIEPENPIIKQDDK